MRRHPLYYLGLLLSAPLPALARAGGGGGGHGGGGGGHGGGSFHGYGGRGGDTTLALWFLGAVVVLVVALNLLQRVRFREQQLAVERLLAQLTQQDALWNLRHLTARVSEVFFRVQHAWTQNDQEPARDCMSARLYRQHKQQTDELLARGQRNVLEDIRLDEVAIYSMADYQDDRRDTFAARLSGSMVDYTLNSPQSPLLPPGTLLPESFTEIWTFVRVENRWVLDSIAPEASQHLLTRGVAYSEAFPPAQP